jgi:hypothetical protein
LEDWLPLAISFANQSRPTRIGPQLADIEHRVYDEYAEQVQVSHSQIKSRNMLCKQLVSLACLFLIASGHALAELPLKPRRPELPPVVDQRSNPLDRIVDAYFIANDVGRPSVAVDRVFLRRVHLDVIGLLPEPDVLKAFVADTDRDKRQRLIGNLLANDVAYTEHWLTFWNDLLRNDYTGTGFITGGRKQITPWLYKSLLDNKPYDQLVRELIAPSAESEGFIRGIRWRGNVNASQTQEIQFAQNISQAFLGINMKCASCHDSFIDRWSLAETYGLAAVYSQQPLTLHRCDKPLEETAQAKWMFPELGQIDASAPQAARLKQLADLMTHADNGRFTRTIVNRLWHRLMGRGIVHPVDAMQSEPWSHDLLDYLAVYLADHDYDLKKTIALICTSQIYQSVTPPIAQQRQEGEYVFRGPQTRRMTAEQYVDAVWQITRAAPSQHDAKVIRFKQEQAKANRQVGAKWIWSDADASAAAPARQAIALRHTFELKKLPTRAVAALTCDNSYRLFLNGQLIREDGSWETVESVSLQPHLRQGANEILIAATNGGDGPNPAGLIFEAILRFQDDKMESIATNSSWEWTSAVLDARGRFKKKPEDWQPAAVVKNPAVWSGRVDPQLAAALTAAANSTLLMVRASLVKSDHLMRTLGRPNRDQIVTSRPSELTTLEAINLANGQTLASAIERGARRAIADHGESPEELVRWLCRFCLSREPTADELAVGRELLGAKPAEGSGQDLMWSIFMLPEFQLVR